MIGMEPYPGSFGYKYYKTLDELFEEVILVENGTKWKDIDGLLPKAFRDSLCRVEC